jgi:nucleoside-diphosphate kinase
MDIDQTLVILKPDAVQRGLVGQIISRFELRGLKIVAMKMLQLSRELAEKHYAVHRGKDFYPPLVQYITSAPAVVMVIAGPSAIEVVRKMMGATDSRQADPGTIRGDWGLSKQANLVHGSDSPQTAATEIALFFRPDELLNYDRADQKWVWPS